MLLILVFIFGASLCQAAKICNLTNNLRTLFASPEFSSDPYAKSLLEELEQGFFNAESFYSPKKAIDQNATFARMMKRLPLEPSQKIVEASPEKIEQIWARVKSNPIYRNIDSQYDPRKTGICMGQAMLTHLEALQQGMDKNQILKVWSVGDLGHGA